MKHGKRYRSIVEKVDRSRQYSIAEAVRLVRELKSAKFDESVDLAVKTGLDPTKADQKIRGTVSLPHGTGKEIRVLVFAKGEKETEARAAGAEYVGSDDLVQKIQKGWTDFDVVISTPDMMKEVGKLGKILGPRGLMPNPKTQTVTFDLAQAVKEFKAGKIEITVDKLSNIHLPIGKVSFDEQKLEDNLVAALKTIIRMKPSAVKGVYICGAVISSTMGPGIKLDLSEIRTLA